jgi:nitroreductase
MDLYEAIRGRRTINEFNEEAPERALLQRLIETAVWAPNHHRTEPWRFIVVAGGERKAFGEGLAEWLEQGGLGTVPEERDVRRARHSMLQSPVTIAVAQAIPDDDDSVRDLEDYAACCCAAQNLMLAAHAEGLGTKWATGRLSRYARAKELLGLRPRDRIVGYIMTGYPAPEPDAEEPRRSPPSVGWRGL